MVKVMAAIFRARVRCAIGSFIPLATRAVLTGKLTSATFHLLDPVPFFAEFALWISSGMSRKKKAKEFLELDPVNSRH